MLKNIPDWLYEPLPYLYTLAGIATVVMLDVLIGKLSGILLISAGIVIWHLRFVYRRHHRRPRKRDLSWGVNQRMHPPKDLDTVKRQKPQPAERVPAKEDL